MTSFYVEVLFACVYTNFDNFYCDKYTSWKASNSTCHSKNC